MNAGGLQRPPALRRGDAVGVVSPSSPLAALHPRRMERALAALERLGFRTVVGDHARSNTGHSAGSPRERVDDLHRMFLDPEIAMVMCTVGGFTSNQLLEEIDYNLIGANPKVFVGYSDITAMHAAIWKRTGLTTILGPALLTEFGEADGVDDYTWTWFENVAMRPEAPGKIPPSREWTDERLQWDSADDRRRHRVPNPGPVTLVEGRGEGHVVAGNLSTILLLAGTDYWPDMAGAVLCLEDDHQTTSDVVDRHLIQLRHLGVFDRISALALGRFPSIVDFSRESLRGIVERATGGHELPVAAGFDFGHTTPMFSLPYGIRARLSAGTTPEFELLEAAVS